MSDDRADTLRIDTANSTWVFEPERMRFWRAPRGLDVNSPMVARAWQRYYALEIDADSGAITVWLNEDGTRLLRAWQDPPAAPGEATTELERTVVTDL